MFATRDILFDLTEFLPYFEPTRIKPNEFNIINATDKVLIIIFHNTLKFAILGLNTKEEQEELKTKIANDFNNKDKYIITLPKLNDKMRIQHIKTNIDTLDKQSP